MSFLASSTLRLLLSSLTVSGLTVSGLAVSGIVLAGCGGQVGATCQQASDCAAGLSCSNASMPSTWPRGTCVVGGTDANLGADVFSAPDAFSTQDAFGADAFGADAFGADAFGADAFVPVDAAVSRDATVGNDTFTEDAPTDAGAADASVDGG